MTQRLRLAFDDPEGFRSEYERNMSAGGAFVHTDADPELREFVEVEIHLGFCNANLVLEAEVVHKMPGAVAVQFTEDTSSLRGHYEDAAQPKAAPAASAAPAPGSETATLAPPSVSPPLLGEADSSPKVAAPRNLEQVSAKAPPRKLDPDTAKTSPASAPTAPPSTAPVPSGRTDEATAPSGLEQRTQAADPVAVAAAVEAPVEPEVQAEFTQPGFETDPFERGGGNLGMDDDPSDDDVDLSVLERVLEEDEAEWADGAAAVASDEVPYLETDAEPMIEALPVGDAAPMVEATPMPDAAVVAEPSAAAEEAPLLNPETIQDLDQTLTDVQALDAERRQGRRSRAAVPARLATTDFHLDGHTRDLSESGVLISADASELPLGKEVTLRLQSPESGDHLEVAGRVSRHIEADGTVAAVGVEFDVDQAEQAAIASFVQSVRASIAERQERGISGVIEELGMPNLVQMLGTTSDSGTLIAAHGAEEGVIAFTKGTLRYSRLGALRSTKALSRMLAWEDGYFEFYSSVDALDDEDEPKSLDAAILEAVRQLDERTRMGAEQLDMSTSFSVDRSGQMADPEPSKIEEAVVDLAEAGFSLRRIIDVIPESDADILIAVHNLVDNRVLAPV